MSDNFTEELRADFAEEGNIESQTTPITVEAEAVVQTEGGRDAPVQPTSCDLDPVTPAPTGTAEGGKGGEVATPPEPAAPPSPPFVPHAAHDTPGPDIYTPAPTRNPVIAAVEALGLYGAELGDGRHSLTCPWAHEHPADAAADAFYSEPSHRYPAGNFSCANDHASPRCITDLLEYCSVEPDAARCKAIIHSVVGELPRVVDAVEYVLSRTGNYYVKGGQIVALRGDNAKRTIEPLNDQTLLTAMGKAANYDRYDRKANRMVRCDPPQQVIHALLKGHEFRYLPELKGIAHQPYFDIATGRLVSEAGYDLATGIFGAFDPADFTLLPPTRENAERALAMLQDLDREFCFASDVDFSAAIAAKLTATVRTALPLAPAINITAPASGSGKSLQKDAIAEFAAPNGVMNVSYPANSEEATKAMLSMLLQSPPAIGFDDMQDNWRPFGIMNRMLTAETISDRVLGSTKVATARTNTLIIGTGNNIGPVGDMSRRVVSIRLAPRVASTTMMRFDGNPMVEMQQRRGHYVGCALTIICAWRAAGCPRADVPPVPSFGVWSDYCRQPLLWLGLPDPATSLFEQVQNDPATEALGSLLASWYGEFGASTVTVRKVLDHAVERPNCGLEDALEDLPISERGIVNRSKFGWYLKRNVGRIVNGLELRKGESSERNAWCVVPVQNPSSPALPPLTA